MINLATMEAVFRIFVGFFHWLAHVFEKPLEMGYYKNDESEG